MPMTSAGPRRRSATGGSARVFTFSTTDTSATAGCLEPSVSTAAIAPAAPWRIQGRKLRLAGGIRLLLRGFRLQPEVISVFDFVRRNHLPARPGAIHYFQHALVLAPG